MARISRIDGEQEWLTPAEVARLFRVDPKTVTRWAQAGVIPDDEIIWTLGQGGKGHRRYRRSWFDKKLKNGGR